MGRHTNLNNRRAKKKKKRKGCTAGAKLGTKVGRLIFYFRLSYLPFLSLWLLKTARYSLNKGSQAKRHPTFQM